MKIREWIEFFELLVPNEPDRETVYWLDHDDHGQCESYYCYDCVVQIHSDLVSKRNDIVNKLDGEHPCWTDCTDENLYIEGYDPSFESDSIQNCEKCGAMLRVLLTSCGVSSELDHFETEGIEGNSNIMHFIDALKGIEDVEDSRFPNEWLRDWQIKEARDNYNTAIVLAQKFKENQDD